MVPESEKKTQNCFFLSHHGIISQDKEIAKLHVALHNSAKTANDVSLNDCLFKGPNQTPPIFDILLKFRFHQVALVADVKNLLIKF